MTKEAMTADTITIIEAIVTIGAGGAHFSAFNVQARIERESNGAMLAETGDVLAVIHSMMADGEIERVDVDVAGNTGLAAVDFFALTTMTPRALGGELATDVEPHPFEPDDADAAAIEHFGTDAASVRAALGVHFATIRRGHAVDIETIVRQLGETKSPVELKVLTRRLLLRVAGLEVAVANELRITHDETAARKTARAARAK